MRRRAHPAQVLDPASPLLAVASRALLGIDQFAASDRLGWVPLHPGARVRVNVVGPGPVQTPLYGKLGLDAATLDATADKIKGLVPIGRFGTPDEIASTVLHLSAPESAFIVGAEIIASGGMGVL